MKLLFVVRSCGVVQSIARKGIEVWHQRAKGTAEGKYPHMMNCIASRRRVCILGVLLHSLRFE